MDDIEDEDEEGIKKAALEVIEMIKAEVSG
jgi:hypothetical protein